MLVLDSSAVLAWALDDEQGFGPELLARLITTETAVVPVHWVLEVANGLRMAVRRRRLEPGAPAQIMARIRDQPIQVDPETVLRGWREIPEMAESHGLTVYDAAYLELALRLELPLATLDQDLARAARKAGVALFS